jgi:hypothetical protein
MPCVGLNAAMVVVAVSQYFRNNNAKIAVAITLKTAFAAGALPTLLVP